MRSEMYKRGVEPPFFVKQNAGMDLPKYCRLTLVPVLMILVIPFYIYIPHLQRQQLLRLLNETITFVRNESRHGA